MDLNKVTGHQLIFGKKNIHFRFMQHHGDVIVGMFGLNKPHMGNNKVDNDEIACYLLGLSFNNIDTLNGVIKCLEYARELFDTQDSVVYSQGNQEADYDEK